MPEPLFTDTLQIGLVVRDLDASMRTYFYEYGIGPWKVYEMDETVIGEMRNEGQPAAYAMRIGVADVGRVQWELIQPLDDRSNYAAFLAAKGEGVHHLGVAVRDYDEALAGLLGRGHSVRMSGVYDGIPYTYVSTDQDLGVITEIFNWPEGHIPQPDSFYPPGSA